jgi:hydrogenase nickel incorporation protein HypB
MAKLITIERKILDKNADVAAENRRWLDAHGLFAVGLLSAPGSGKTSLLERLLVELGGRVRCAVVEGDVKTDRDARRIAALGAPAVQIVTNGTCHLEAGMVRQALERLPRRGLQLVFVENVGNLVCPAAYELGEHLRLAVMSTTEGEDKPLKYPAVFRKADALVINKLDLLPYLDFDLAEARAHALAVNPRLELFETSCTTGAGIGALASWLCERRARSSRSAAAAPRSAARRHASSRRPSPA